MRVDGNLEKALPENEMKDADHHVDGGGPPDLGPLHRQDVADQHVPEMFRLAGGLAHRQDHRRRCDRVRDADDRFLRDARLVPLDHGEDQRADHREAEAHPVDLRIGVRVVALPHGNRRAERRDLREREVDEDHPSLDDVQTEVGVNAGDDQARRDRRRQELQNAPVHRCLLSGQLFQRARQQPDVVVEQLDVIAGFFRAAD